MGLKLGFVDHIGFLFGVFVFFFRCTLNGSTGDRYHCERKQQ
jgi:hypothetical protein